MFNTGLTRFLPQQLRRLVSDLLWKVADRPRFQPELSVQPGGPVLGCCTAYNKYGGYCVPLSANYRPAARKVLAGKVWEPDTLDFMIANARGGDIVHAGTFFGDFIPALARAVDADHRVWAFEPNPENARCAHMTIMLNDLQNVTLTSAGLGAALATVNMEVRDDLGRSLGGASHIVDTAESVTSAKVQIVTVDGTVPADRKVGIIQLDVEGFEQQALTGAIKAIRRCKPILILETLPSREWLDENILSLGYREAGRLHDNFVLAPTK